MQAPHIGTIDRLYEPPEENTAKFDYIGQEERSMYAGKCDSAPRRSKRRPKLFVEKTLPIMYFFRKATNYRTQSWYLFSLADRLCELKIPTCSFFFLFHAFSVESPIITRRVWNAGQERARERSNIGLLVTLKRAEGILVMWKVRQLWSRRNGRHVGPGNRSRCGSSLRKQNAGELPDRLLQRQRCFCSTYGIQLAIARREAHLMGRRSAGAGVCLVPDAGRKRPCLLGYDALRWLDAHSLQPRR